MSEKLKAAVRKRGSIRARLTRFKNYIDQFTTRDSEIAQLQERVAKVKELWSEFDAIQTEIESEQAEDSEEERDKFEKERDEFEKEYFDLLSAAQGFINEHDTHASLTLRTPELNAAASTSAVADQPVKLPSINLTKFSGHYDQWLPFYDVFKSMVHDNNRISPVQKFFYLRSALEGDAARVIESLQTSAENYTIAWTLLIERYENRRVIIQSHIRAFVELPNITKESSIQLHALIDNSLKHLRALKALGEKTEHWNSIILYLVTLKLDKNTHKEWERSVNGKEMPTLDQLWDFLRNRCYALENLSADGSTFKMNQGTRASTSNKPLVSYVSTSNEASCPICKMGHKVQFCTKFIDLDIDAKRAAVRSNGLCFNCLRPRHMASECKSEVNCRKCKKRHHTLLHPIKVDMPKADVDSSNATSKVTNLQAFVSPHILLSTAVVTITNNNGESLPCKIILDSGSQSNFMTERMVKALNLPKREIDIPVSGFNQTVTNIKHAVNATISSRDKRFRSELNFLVIPKITDQFPSHYINKNELNIPKNLPLADPEFCKPAQIDALIGAEIFYNILCIGQIKIHNAKIILQKTRFGWLVTGKVNGINNPRLNGNAEANHLVCNLAIDTVSAQLQKFWEIEELPPIKHLSDNEKLCEKLFLETTRRDASGRYIVRLPFNTRKPEIGESRAIAERRFLSLERRLSKDKQLREEYSKFIEEYIQLGHMSECRDYQELSTSYYLPHHPVMKRTSLTTKLRVVFDASSKTSTNVSLNDALMAGPNVQEDIFSITTRFRSHTYVLAADIEKMYRQIRLHPEDVKYQLILWREHPNDKLKTYKLNTLTYGTSPASFLATRCIQQLALEEGNSFPLAAKSAKQDFYVDDLLTGSDTLEEAVELRNQLIGLLKQGGFNLRQWCSNESLLTEPLTHTSNDPHICINVTDTHKTLGIHWVPQDDNIIYTIHLTQNDCVTKRTMLSQIASLFDPLGLLAPVIVKAKTLIRELWLQKLEWDESVPLAIATTWKKYKNQLEILNNFSVPRKIIVKPVREVQLHGFCDASENAYGACIYVRSTNESEEHIVRLVCSKSRIAPMKRISLPRLELCAALLLTKLYDAVIRALKLKFEKVFFWSDSTITLNWIKAPPYKLKTFVANRVARIQDISGPIVWRHTPSEYNAADAVSRGQLPNEFINNIQWKNGPYWLATSEEQWPEDVLTTIEIPEQKTIINLKITTDTNIFEKFSSLKKLKRVIGYCLRFAYNSLHTERRTGELTSLELENAMDCILKNVQLSEFQADRHNLMQGHSVNSKSKLLPLSPFVDSKGIIRVGGRTQQANIEYDQKHPIVLPKNNHVTELIIREEHIKTYHGAVQLTLYTVRQKYWPLDGKNYTKHIIRKCVACFRVKPRMPEYLMGNLPRDRLVASRPFENIGLDFCGPFFVKEKTHRNRNKIKIYVAVFICLVTKAVHLEVVGDLSTAHFIASLRRFVARRGKPKIIHSDNATNFQGAHNELKDLYELWQSDEHIRQVNAFSTNDSITWKFIPPRSPHFGGIWEAAVKGFKYHMRRVIGETLLSIEEFNTFTIEIEGILNSRPLTAMSADPNDLLPLTPAHFIIGCPLTSIPSADFKDVPVNRLSNWEHLQKMKQHFWQRWYKEYLNELQQRSKWTSNKDEQIRIGGLTLLKEDNIAPQYWKLGRIVDIHPGYDKIVRVVTVKTATGTYKRSVKKIAPLPIE